MSEELDGLLTETIARHFPEARADKNEIDLGFGGLSIGLSGQWCWRARGFQDGEPLPIARRRAGRSPDIRLDERLRRFGPGRDRERRLQLGLLIRTGKPARAWPTRPTPTSNASTSRWTARPTDCSSMESTGRRGRAAAIRRPSVPASLARDWADGRGFHASCWIRVGCLVAGEALDDPERFRR